MDHLSITGLKLSTRIGVYAWEQHINQTLLLDISCPIVLNKPHVTLAETLDYARLCQSVTAFVQARAFELIEHVAEQVAHLILTEFSVPSVTLSVCKPFACANAQHIKLSITRRREGDIEKKKRLRSPRP